MKRRTFFKIAVPLVAVPTAGSWFFHHHFSDHNGAKRLLSFQNLDEAMSELDKIKQHSKLAIDSDWTLYQNMVHCAQSIEFSMDGFPQPKPALFQKTIGQLVFNHFDKQGYMRHNRSEAIPGAPTISESGNLDQAFDRVTSAIVRFDQYGQEFKPHFAYGKLSKAKYENAHCMHLADHFAMITYNS